MSENNAMKLDQRINDLTQRVCRAAKESLGDKLDKVILYGSFARGDYDEESDIDILILANVPQENAFGESMKISRLLSGIDLEFDILVSFHVTSLDVFNKFFDVTPFYMNVMKEGVILSA
jgi:predicted nucleotidyltransferase